jgi:hypothetical protein
MMDVAVPANKKGFFLKDTLNAWWDRMILVMLL